ncbi:MAG TPA: hypothetical protein VGL53_05850 [Bryobacteraceae bacterium]|jgi:hypothetical protein
MSLKIALAALVSSLAFGQFASIRSHIDGETMTVTFSSPQIIVNEATGAPYSGERVSEHVQTLPDGTHIKQTISRTKIWRDSQGRTRTERTLGASQPGSGSGGFFVIEILDPVAGFMYVLDDQQRVAHRFAISAAPPHPRPVTAAGAPKSAATSTYEKLGTQDIEGVPAEGTRSTRTIPIGEIGNDGPITTSTESWFCRDLRLLVLMKRVDQLGEHTMRFTQIDRSEPEPALFMSPAGYTVAEEKDSLTLTLKRQ